MPNPTPRPYALNVYLATPPSGVYEEIGQYIGKQYGPTIRFNANGLTAETSLPLHYTGNLPYSIQEWASVQIQAIDNSEWIFNGYVSKLTSSRQGPQRFVTLSCVDGNIKLRRGVGRSVDGGDNAIIDRSYTFPAGTSDRDIIQNLLAEHLPDVSGIYVNNIFNLSAEWVTGYCTIYDALVELRKQAPSGPRIRFYVGFDQTSGLPWHLNWFDTAVIPVSPLVLSDDPYPGANTSNYWTWQRIRDGLPIYNRWTVVGKDLVTGGRISGTRDNSTSQSDLGVIIAGISTNEDLHSVAECEAEADRILLNRGTARESITGLETHNNLLLTGPQLIRVKNDLEPGITTPTVFPVEGTSLQYVQGREPMYVTDLGDRFLALGEEDEGGSFGTRPVRDTTPPDPPTWLTEPPNPLLNQYNPLVNDVTLKVGWNSNTEGDLLRYRLHRRRYTNNNPALPEAWDLGVQLNAGITDFSANYPPGVLVGHVLYAEDTANNISLPSAVYNRLTTTDTIPQPTSVAVPSQGPFFTEGVAKETWSTFTANLGGYSNTPYTVRIKCFSGNHVLLFDRDNTLAQPWYCYGFKFGGFTYTVRIAIVNQYGVLGPYSAPVTFVTPNHAPRGGLDRGHVWEDPDFDNNLVGVSSIVKGSGTTWSIVSTSGYTDFGPRSFKASLANSSEFIIIELAPQSLKEAKPLTWFFSLRANRNSPAGIPSGTFSYKIKWLNSLLGTISTDTIKSSVPPPSAQSAFWYQSGQVAPPSGAVAFTIRLEYSATTGAEDVYFGQVGLTDQIQAVNVADQAITARAQQLGVPATIYNGDLEIGNFDDTLPDGYFYSGPSTGYTYAVGGNRQFTMGKGAGSYVFRTPYILTGSYTVIPFPYIRIRWYQSAHASGVGTVVARCYNESLTSLGTINLLTNAVGTYSFQNGYTGEVEVQISPGGVLLGTRYIAIEWGWTATGNQPLTLDRIRVEEITSAAATAYQFRNSAGNLLSTMRTGLTAARPAFVDQNWFLNYETYYIELERTIAATNRRLSQPFHVQMQNYASDHPPYNTGGEKLAVPLEGSHGHDLYLLQWSLSMHVAGGTNNGSNYWTCELRSLNSGIGFDSHATVNTSADAPNVWLPVKGGTSFSNNPISKAGRWLQMYLSTTGAPSPLDCLIDIIACEVL